MTDKTMKERHDDAPSRASDTTAEYYLQAVQDVSSTLLDAGLNKTQLGNLIDAVMGYTDSLNSLSSRIDSTDDNVATNAQDIADIQETLGNLITESPGDIQWEAVSSAVNEGSNVTIRLNRVNYGFQPPDATYTSTVTWGDDAPIAGDSMELDGVAYTSGTNIDWTQTDLFHVITYKSSAASISSDATVTLTSAAASPMGDGSPVLNTLTITNEGAVSAPGTFAFVSSGYSDTEERSPVQTLTIGRSGGSDGAVTVNYTLANISAVAGENYVQHTSSSIIIADGAVSGTIDVQTVHNGITSNKSLSCTIDSVSIGTIGAQNSTTITINKLAGFWSQPASAAGSADGDVDWNTIDPEAQLDEYVGSRSQTGGTYTLDKVWIDATGDAQDVDAISLDAATAVSITNVYIKSSARAGLRVDRCFDVTFRNNYVNGSARDTTSSASNIYGFYSNKCENTTHTVMNNKFAACNGDVLVNESSGCTDNNISWNYTTGPLDDIRNTSAVAFIFSRQQVGASMDHNTMYCPRAAFGGTGAGSEDVYTVQGTRGNTSSDIIYFRYNRAMGGGESTSSTALHIGENNSRYIHATNNVALEYSTSGLALTGGHDNVLTYNRMYTSEEKPGSDNSYGFHIWRSGAGSAAGEMYDNTFGYNVSSNWQEKAPAAATNQNRWFPLNGSDGFLPNHGPTAGEDNVMPVGWGSGRFDLGTNTGDDGSATGWDGNAGEDGYDALFNRLRVMKQPTNVSFIMVENASHDTAIGPGTISYDGAGSVTWAEQGDTAGTAIDLTGTNPNTGATYAVDDMFFITTGSHDSGSLKEFKTIECILTAAASGGSASDSDIMVTAIEHYKSQFWAGENGDMS